MEHDINFYRRLMRSRGFSGEDAETLVHKVALISEIKAIIEENCWTQIEAAKQIKVKQPRIAELNKVSVDKFSTDLLIKYLYRLKRLVKVEVLEAPIRKSQANTPRKNV